MASMLRAILLIYVLAVSTGAAGQLTPMYQLYHPGSTDHFYTIDLDTRIRARDFYGFTDQGVAFFVERTNVTDTRPLRRFYKGVPETDHFYTIDSVEANTVLNRNWVEEGVEGYVYIQEVAGSVPLYRLSWAIYNGDHDHIFTTEYSSAQQLMSQGWNLDGIKGYVFRQPPVALNAQYVSESLESAFGSGVAHNISVRMRNTGAETWIKGQVKLGSQVPQDNWTWGTNRFELPYDVAPGVEVDIPMSITKSGSGYYAWQWRMVKEGVAWFGDYTPYHVLAVIQSGTYDGSVLGVSPTTISGWACWNLDWSLPLYANVFRKKNSYDPDWGDAFVGSTPSNQSTPQGCTTNKGFNFGIPDTRADGIWLKDGQTHWFVSRAVRTTEANGGFDLRQGYQAITVPDTRPDKSQFLEQSIATAATSQSATQFSITFKNTGDNVWRRSTHTLLPVSPGEPWNVGAGVMMWRDVWPGESFVFTFTPVFSRGAGDYVSVWKVARSGVPFGQASLQTTTSYRTSSGTTSPSQPLYPSAPSPLPYNYSPPATPVNAVVP